MAQLQPLYGATQGFQPASGQRAPVDPRTGYPLSPTGFPASQPNAFQTSPLGTVQFDPNTGQYYVIDRVTGQRVVVDPNAAQSVATSFNGRSFQRDTVTNQFYANPDAGQQIQVDPMTGQPMAPDVNLLSDSIVNSPNKLVHQEFYQEDGFLDDGFDAGYGGYGDYFDSDYEDGYYSDYDDDFFDSGDPFSGDPSAFRNPFPQMPPLNNGFPPMNDNPFFGPPSAFQQLPITVCACLHVIIS